MGLTTARRRRTGLPTRFSARGLSLFRRAVNVRRRFRGLFGIGFMTAFMTAFKASYKCPWRGVIRTLERRWLKPAAGTSSSGTLPGCNWFRDLFPVVVPPFDPNDHRLLSGSPPGWPPRGGWPRARSARARPRGRGRPVPPHRGGPPGEARLLRGAGYHPKAGFGRSTRPPSVS